jgi:hypothetical protein
MSRMNIELGFVFPSRGVEEPEDAYETEDNGAHVEYALGWQAKSDRGVQVSKPRKIEVTVDKKRVMVPNTIIHGLGGRTNFESPSKKVQKRLFADDRRKEKEGKAKGKKAREKVLA